ncbi:MAG TPA: hypothetical protein VHT91_31505, partial [Kofleriaceae bacterium]|nr:hypothetical protein [Kofleriaceae bacterium]
MMVPVHSSQLQFTRDGGTLVVADPDGIALLGAGGDGQRRVAVAGVHAVAAFTDQVWVTTRAGRLIRLGLDGRQLDDHALPHDPDGCLIPATIGGPSALWAAREPALLLDDLGSLVVVAGPHDAAIPIAGRRFARHAGSRLSLPGGTTVMLGSAAQIAGGCVIFDGTSLALITEQPRGRDLVVVALASGRTRQTVALPPGMVRIAPRRGLAVVHEAARWLSVLDLRSTRWLGTVVADDEVVDVAVDPGGKQLAIRLACGEIELAPIGDRMRPGSGARLSAPDAGTVEASRNAPDEVEIHEVNEVGGVGEVGEVAPAEAPVPPGASAGAVVAASRLADIRSVEVASTDAVSPADDGEVLQGRAGVDHGSLFVAPQIVEAPDPRPRRAIVSAAMPRRDWLDVEMEWIWLCAETELRRLQALQLRPALPEIESMLAERRAARIGRPAPFDSAELHRMLEGFSEALPALRTPVFRQLAGRLGLSRGDIEALLLIAAPSIDPPLADLFAAVRGPAMARRGVDLALIGQLVSSGRGRRIELLELLDEQRPPLANHLIQIAPAQDVYSSASYRSIQPTLDLLWL